LKSYPEIGTRLAAIGDWRATVTEYDWEYVEQVQSGSGNGGGGHVSGGTMSLLYHRTLGPLCVASMTQYQIIEISNQQVHLDSPHMALTLRIESSGAKTYTSTSDFAADVTVTSSPGLIGFNALGRLLTAAHQPMPDAGSPYHLAYNFTPNRVEIVASAEVPAQTPLSFILPIVARQDEAVERVDPQTIRITKPSGVLMVRTDLPAGFDAVPKERTFNLVPGFECVPLAVPMSAGKEVRIQLEVAVKK
jgi:hypothetical protein